MFAHGAQRRADPRSAVQDDAEREAAGRADALTESVRDAIAPGGKLFEQLQGFLARKRQEIDSPPVTAVRPARRDPE
jgi:hypothetical protein